MFDKKIEHRIIRIENIRFAPEIIKLNRLVNPFALLKNKESDFTKENIDDLLLMFPLFGYFGNDKFYLISGIFTFNTIVQTLKGGSAELLVSCLSKKPSSKTVKKLYLLYVSQQIVNQFFITDASLIGRVLSSWFTKPKNGKSFLVSKEWLDFFPTIDTKNKLAKHLSISKTNL